MEIQVEDKEGFQMVTPVGELDVYTVPLFRKVILKLESDRRRDLIIDLSRVTFIDSSGLGCLIETYQKGQSSRSDILFVLENPRILKILKLVNLDRVLRIFPNLGQALQSVGVSGGYVDDDFFSDIR